MLHQTESLFRKAHWAKATKRYIPCFCHYEHLEKFTQYTFLVEISRPALGKILHYSKHED